MTREEAIRALERADGYVGIHYINGVEEAYINPHLREAVKVALSALRPISREKVWRGEWIVQQDEHKEYIKRCSKCGFPISGWWGADKFCANCGAPMTDEAVEMVMERWEAVKNDKE